MSAKDNKEENKNIDVEEEIVLQTGDIYGETLKGIAMGKYFKDCEIDEEECYVIELYEPKETEEEVGWQ